MATAQPPSAARPAGHPKSLADDEQAALDRAHQHGPERVEGIGQEAEPAERADREELHAEEDEVDGQGEQEGGEGDEGGRGARLRSRHRGQEQQHGQRGREGEAESGEGDAAHLRVAALGDGLASALCALAADLADGGHGRADAMVLEQQQARDRGVDDHEERAGGDAPPGHGRGHHGDVAGHGGAVRRDVPAPEAKHH